MRILLFCRLGEKLPGPGTLKVLAGVRHVC